MTATHLHADALVLVAHGSRSDAGRRAMEELAAAVATACPEVEVRSGFLELCDPPALSVLDALVRQGARRVVVVPAMLHAAGHTKSDVPAVVAEARLRTDGTEIVYARPFGADHVLLDLARRRITAVGGEGLPLVVAARGTSDPDANGEAYRVARLVAEMVHAPAVVPAFAGVTWPTVPDALAQLAALGATEVCAFAWFIATGVLLDRMREDFAAFAVRRRVPVRDAGHLGTGAELVSLVLARATEAIAGRAVPNCDACAYRAPFPGLEDRVGASVGSGHSHLAAAHLQHGSASTRGHRH